jgi:lipopolysaccharide/colanic/teichoic acid biosynthesis glycosyltransferase
VKRAFDLIAGAALLVVTLPLIGISAIAVMLRTGGPPFFAHDREGRGGQSFRMWKLRTMVVDADAMLRCHLELHPEARDEWHRYFRLREDPRVAGAVGRTLRRLSIDELPQLWNVVRGEMSLVGPRPLPPFVIEALPPGFLDLRRRVRPGLTGLWQVSGRSELDLTGLVEVDLRYLTSPSLRMDVRILLRTPAAVIGSHGAY